MNWWSNLKKRYEVVVEEYGKAAFGTYLVLFGGTLFAFWGSIRAGWETSGVAASAGTIGGAYLLTKATQPIRIAATVVVTPVVVQGWRRFRGVAAD